MKSGLYERPGVSATAWAAAWASRLEEAATKVSKVNFESSWTAGDSRPPGWRRARSRYPCRPRAAPGSHRRWPGSGPVGGGVRDPGRPTGPAPADAGRPGPRSPVLSLPRRGIGAASSPRAGTARANPPRWPACPRSWGGTATPPAPGSARWAPPGRRPRRGSPSGTIPESHSCHVVSETWSRNDPVHFVQRSAAWFTAVPIAPSPPSASSHCVRNGPRYG